MSWGTCFNVDFFINREKYDNIYQLDEEIKSTEKEIQELRERLFMYCACGCNGVNHKDCEDNPVNPVDAMYVEINSLLEQYNEEQGRLQLLYYLREDWDEQESKFKTAQNC
jgi:hypothetical protein